MDKTQLEHYLHQHIPLSADMEVSVLSASNNEIQLTAPLEPNINHRATVFGGSASALALLAGWSLLHLRLTIENIPSRIVIQHNTMHYSKPMADRFTAKAELKDPEKWNRFITVLNKKKRSRITLSVDLHCQQQTAGHLEGDFVALLS